MAMRSRCEDAILVLSGSGRFVSDRAFGFDVCGVGANGGGKLLMRHLRSRKRIPQHPRESLKCHPPTIARQLLPELIQPDAGWRARLRAALYWTYPRNLSVRGAPELRFSDMRLLPESAVADTTRPNPSKPTNSA